VEVHPTLLFLRYRSNLCPTSYYSIGYMSYFYLVLDVVVVSACWQNLKIIFLLKKILC